jgi:hypothetical protein
MKRAKRPPSTSSKGISWGTFFSCQGDEDCVIFEGSQRGRFFNQRCEHQLGSFLRVLGRIMKTSLLRKQTCKR